MCSVLLQTATPTPGVGVGELVDYWPDLFRAGWFLVGFLVVVALGWLVVTPLVSRAVGRRNRNNPTIEEAVTRYVRLVFVVVGLFAGAGTAGYGGFVGNSAVVIAAITLAIGVAAQSVVGSLVSGFVLVLDPQFNVGNYIEWDGGEGVVQSITLRVTRVRTPDGELVTVPNTVLTEQAVTRPYGQARYRVVEHVGIAYESDVEEAMELLLAVAEELAEVTDAPSPRVYVDEFGPDSVVVRVHYWLADARKRDVFEVRSAYARAAKPRLEGAGITISPASKRELQGRIEVDDGER